MPVAAAMPKPSTLMALVTALTVKPILRLLSRFQSMEGVRYYL